MGDASLRDAGGGHGSLKLEIVEPAVDAGIRTGVAAKQRELRDLERTESGRAEVFHFLAEMAERDGVFDAGESEVGREGALVKRNAEGGKTLFDFAGEILQCAVTGNTGPENSRGTFAREPAEILYVDFEGAARWQSGEGCAQFVEAFGRPLANELSGDVEIIERTPFDERFGTERGHETIQAAEDVGREVDGCKETHNARGNVLA